jgi:hypothetical protein
MSGGNAITPVEQRHDGGASRLLPDVQVIVAHELPLAGQPQHGFLEATYQQHRFENGPCELVE